ncbi:hypothetical protein BABINDRAFT_165940 [Babjeviella inositovora NRRL Y-12698]|uniref:Bul1 N-terminal domain-containing protein n=1 Tax=Babjeviella inositovora NRRL Y-12698 TaxID=984486 RepID=A0A1E3QW85_9ASCO|nr:uncharacterized protein BABINDRAFT_165940 [Babjeviella inositovora NRRL Y-12698]ODQ81247.1 hypothetical protein BABINDRAFT_165940 [Babjeviella inositovora NRRL Y-12698]
MLVLAMAKPEPSPDSPPDYLHEDSPPECRILDTTPPYFKHGYSNDEKIHNFHQLPKAVSKKIIIEIVTTTKPDSGNLTQPLVPTAADKLYTNGDYVCGYINIQSTYTEPLPYAVFAVTFSGNINLSSRNNSTSKTILHTIDLFASSYPEVDAQFAVLTARDYDGVEIALPYSYDLLPRVKYRKYFVFKIPTKLLDTFCEHGELQHCSLPPTIKDRGTGLGVKYAIEAFLVCGSTLRNDDFVVKGYKKKEVRFHPRSVAAIEPELPDMPQYLRQTTRTLETVEDSRIRNLATRENIAAARPILSPTVSSIKVMYSSAINRSSVRDSNPPPEIYVKYQSSNKVFGSTLFLTSNCLGELRLQTRLHPQIVPLLALRDGVNVSIPLVLQIEFFPQTKSKPPKFKSFTASFVALTVESRYAIPIHFSVDLFLNNGGKTMANAKATLKSIAERALELGNEAFSAEVAKARSAIHSMSVTQRRYYKSVFAVKGHAGSLWGAGNDTKSDVELCLELGSTGEFAELKTDIIPSYHNCFINRLYGIKLDVNFANNVTASLYIPITVV